MPIENMTPEQIAEATRAQVTAGIKSTTKAAKLNGETQSEANARLTAAYKELTAKPILSQEQIAGGMKVQYVRTQAGGFGEYVPIKPLGYTGPTKVEQFTDGVIAAGSKYTTGSRVGLDTGNRTVDEYRKVLVGKLTAGNKLTDAEAAWLKANGGTSLNPNVTTVIKSPTGEPIVSTGFETKNGILYNNGIPFNGKTVDGKTYTNGILDESGSLTTTQSTSDSTLTDTTTNTGPTTNIDVLKAALRSLGFTSAILDSSTSFLNSLLKEGLDYDNATEVFLNNKEYTLKSGTKITSPFYTEYGYLNEGLVVPKSASEIFNAVEGYKEVVDKYALSKKYLEKDSLQNYVKNNVTVKDLAERANVATLKSVNQDPAYVEALQKLGYISTAADLKDFFLDPKIGQEQLNINRTTGAFTAEAIRRAKSGIQFNSERFKAIAQTMVEKGISETEASALAAQGFENIAAQLGTTTKLSGIYETQRQATMGQIQSELETEEFGGLASERRKRLSEQEIRAFQGSAGTTSSSLRSANVLGII